MKKIVSIILVIIIAIILPLNAYATNNYDADYIRFTAEGKRILNDGSFTFYIHSNTTSNRFKPISNNITLEVSARVKNKDTGSIYSYDNIYYTVYLYRSGYSSAVGYLTQAANGRTATKTFSVTTGVDYYIEIVVSGSIASNQYVTGNGDFSNITIS